MNYWLFKSEPSVFSFEALKAKGKAGTQWDGVRNYAARNNMIRSAIPGKVWAVFRPELRKN